MKKMNRKGLIFTVTLLTALLLFLMTVACIVGALEDSGLNIVYCNLSFENDVHIMYAVESKNPNVKLLIWNEPREEYFYGSQKTVLSPLPNQMEINGKNYTVFQYTGLAAKQMTDDVYARAVLLEEGKAVQYGKMNKYSILQYAYNKLGKTGTATRNEKLSEMLCEMLEYGASAQKYLGYKEDRLATDLFFQVKLTAGNLPDGSTHGLYQTGEEVLLYTPELDAEGKSFSRWVDAFGNSVSESNAFSLKVGTSHEVYTPIYARYSTGLEFESNGDGTCYLIGIGSCTDKDLAIPLKSPEGDKVIGIDRNAFANNIQMVSVTIPTTVEEIGRNAFSGCTELTDVYYDGDSAGWNLIDIASGNTALTSANIHYAVISTYLVTFVDDDGSVIETQQVKPGESAIAPPIPTKDGYLFIGWDKSFENVSDNLKVQATYRPLTAPTIAVSDVTAHVKDGTVQVTIALLGNPGISALKFMVSYGEGLTLENVSFDATFGAYVTAPTPYQNPQSFTFISPLAEISASGRFVTLTFAMDPSIRVETDVDVTVTVDASNTYDENFEAVTFEVVNGKVTVCP